MSSLNNIYAEAKTGVFWDIEDCPIPNGLNLVSVSDNIKSALSKQGYNGEVLITAYKEKKPFRNDFELAGIKLEVSGNKHGRSMSMRNAFFGYALGNRESTNLLVISRDRREFASSLRTISKRHNVLLAESEDPPEKCRKCGVGLGEKRIEKSVFGSQEWGWMSLAVGGDPIERQEVVTEEEEDHEDEY